MVADYKSTWDNCLQHIQKQIEPQAFTTWFEPIKPIQLEEEILTIQVPNKFFYEWIEEHYLDLLRSVITEEIGKTARLEYQIMVEDHREIKSPDRMREESQVPGMYQTEQIKNPFVIPGIKRIRVDPQLNKDYTFENYIEGEFNRLARSAGIAIAKNPGGTAFNPLVIFGDVGLGKTHLAQAIGNEVVNLFPNKTVIYVTTEKFTNQFIRAIKNNAVPDFTNFYQVVDVLIVDDIQFLADRKRTQEIFFNIFNQLHQSGKQIILTSDRAPKDLDGMEERLISRFKWGLTADLSSPDLETRMAILQSKMAQEGVLIPDDVTEFICYNIKANIRELEGVFISLVAQSSFQKREINIPLAKEVVKKFVSNSNKEITVEYIKSIVAEHYKISVEALAGKSRKRQIVTARQVSMYLAKNHTENSYVAIGEEFGKRDHSTVIYSCNQVKDLMDSDRILREAVDGLQRKLSLSLSS